MAKDQSTPSRLTKAERKEQARRERVELQRKMARARRNRRILLVLTTLVVAAVVAFTVTRPSTAIANPGDLLAQAEDASRSAGCGQVRDAGTYQPEVQDRAHVGVGATMPPLSRYATVPPASGPHNPSPLGAGVYSTPPQVDRAIHSLEHGAAIVWYSPDVSGEELDRLTAFYDQNAEAGSRVIVAPYDYPDQGAAGQLPAGTQMALVAWHHIEDCASVNLAAAFDFTARYAAPPFGSQQYLGDAPEAGAGI